MAQRSLYDLINGEFASGNPALAQDAANPDAVVAKQRFVFDFAGKNNAQSNVWTSGGTGTTTIAADGLKIYSSSGTRYISFNNIRPFSKVGCSMIWNSARIGAGGSRYDGLVNTIGTYNRNTAHCFIHNGGMNFTTADNTSAFWTDTNDDGASGIHVDMFTTYKIEQLAGSALLYINGKLAATRTSQLSTLDYQPFSNRFTGTGSTYMRYVEAWNH